VLTLHRIVCGTKVKVKVKVKINVKLIILTILSRHHADPVTDGLTQPAVLPLNRVVYGTIKVKVKVKVHFKVKMKFL
jgi:hypothetical protein